MATSPPSALETSHWDQGSDEVLRAVSQMKSNLGKINALLNALGQCAYLDFGDGLQVESQGANVNDKLELNVDSSFQIVNGQMEASDFFTISSDADAAGDSPPPDLNLRTKDGNIKNGDDVGFIKFRGSTSAGKSENQIYTNIVGKAINVLAGSLAGEIGLRTAVAGTVAERAAFRNGMYMLVNGTPVDGEDKGAGTGNYQDLYRRGSILPVQQVEVVGAITPTNALGGTVTHTLGAVPQIVKPELVCLTAEFGYQVGDIMPLDQPYMRNGGSENDAGLSIALRGTDTIVYKIGINGLRFYDLSTGVNRAVTAANWQLRFRVFG